MYIDIIISIIEVILLVVPALLTVAFVTVAERKTMASMQRRVGPNIVGYYGSLQAFADALKLLLKEYVSPTQANVILFFIGPIITLIFSLLGYAVVSFAPGITIFDHDLGLLFLLAVSSIATYGILIAGWSANSKYAFLGSLRSTAQLISYELVLTSLIFIVVLFSGSLSIIVNIEIQKSVWFLLPIFPLFIAFLVGAVAETNRAPFDLAEAESELVSGFMTEHSAVVFVFFFLAEYASIVLICVLITILFLGGYNVDVGLLCSILELLHLLFYCVVYLPEYFMWDHAQSNIVQFVLYEWQDIDTSMEHLIPENYLGTLAITIKSFVMIFVFIWVRASFPRVRYDQLMVYCWTVLLPIIFAFIIFIPCLIYAFDAMPNTILFY